MYLGSEAFVERMQERIEIKGDKLSIPKAQRRAPTLSLRAIEKRHPERDDAIVAAYATGAFSYREIREYVGLHLATIGRIIRRHMLRGENWPWSLSALLSFCSLTTCVESDLPSTVLDPGIHAGITVAVDYFKGVALPEHRLRDRLRLVWGLARLPQRLAQVGHGGMGRREPIEAQDEIEGRRKVARFVSEIRIHAALQQGRQGFRLLALEQQREHTFFLGLGAE